MVNKNEWSVYTYINRPIFLVPQLYKFNPVLIATVFKNLLDIITTHK